MHVTVADLQDHGNGPGVRGNKQEQAHQPGVVLLFSLFHGRTSSVHPLPLGEQLMDHAAPHW